MHVWVVSQGILILAVFVYESDAREYAENLSHTGDKPTVHLMPLLVQ